MEREKSIKELKLDVRKKLSELVNANKLLISALESAAYVDELTGLLSRRAILDELDAEIFSANRKNECVVIMMMDLNKFKKVNDTLGHDAGDILLREVGRRLKEAFRNEDKVGRLGGDEFMVVCEGTTCTKHISILIEKVMKSFEEPFKGFEAFDVSNSVGVSIFPDHGTEVSVLMKKADIAMYIAKETKTGHHIYTTPDKGYV